MDFLSVSHIKSQSNSVVWPGFTGSESNLFPLNVAWIKIASVEFRLIPKIVNFVEKHKTKWMQSISFYLLRYAEQ